MNNNTKCFIELLSAFINRREPHLKENPDWEAVYRLAGIHNVMGMLFLAANKLKAGPKPSPEVLRRMKKDFFSTVMKSDTQDREMEVIINALNEAEIPHVLMKGFVVKNYYPAREMRTMGDMDILIKPEDREKSHKLLKSLGYAHGYIHGEVWDYTKGVVHLEIHAKIMYHNMHNGTDYVEYFSSAWNHTVQGSKPYTFEFEREYHFLFLMVHMAKHFDGTGCGIRMLMDIAAYADYFKESLHWEYINEELEKLNLRLFSKNIYILCSRWFGTSFDFHLPVMEEGFYLELSEYILSAGTFGFYDRNQEARFVRNEYSQSAQEEKKPSKIGVMINVYRKRLFPNYHTIRNAGEYSFLRNRPLLLPLGWIYRFIYCAIVKGRKSFVALKDIAQGEKEAEKQYRVISRLGL